uniref:Cytochrome P450, family 17, subfamily A, polypeptide 1 n=1 Tax=Callorhinchus milii TaxID=7868 RepID=A0A4W3JIG8_CALMI
PVALFHVGFLTFLFSWFPHRLKLKGTKLPASLPTLPLIGSLLSLWSDDQPHILFQKLQKKYGEIYSLMLGSHYVVVVNNYQHAKEVLLKKGKIFGGRPKSVTTDLLSRDGKDIAFATYSPTWRFHRKLVHSALCMFGEGTSSIEKIICDQATSMCLNFQSLLDSPMDPSQDLIHAVTNVVCTLCFNSSYKRNDPEFLTMLNYSKGIVDTVAKDSLVDIFPWLQIFPNKDLDKLKQCIVMRDKILHKKFQEHKENYTDNSTNDLLDALLTAKMNAENNNSLSQGAGMTDDHLQMTVADIFGAGVETTSTVLRWIWAYLIHNPEVQKRIHEEMDNKIGFDRLPKLNDKSSLPYLNATISEVLRIQPVAPLLIPHVALADSSIGDWTIPKGTRVIINLWSVHHDEQEWKNPATFDPGRFLDEDGNHIYSPSGSYLPFGAGVRVCLGEALAKMEIFLFMAWILQRFTIECPEGQPLPSLSGKFGVVLQPKKFMAQLRPRTAWQKLGQSN